MNICIYGAASNQIDQTYKEEAFLAGKLLAKEGFGMVFGGGCTGLMGAAYEGFVSVGERKELIAVSPYFFGGKNVLVKNADQMIWTDTMRERKQIMEDKADGFLVLPGGIGTLDEFFEIITNRQLGLHDKPIVLLNCNGYFNPIREMIGLAVSQGFMKAKHEKLCVFADTAKEAVSVMKNEI